MKVVVTGGAGFIGGNLVRAMCRDRWAEIVVVDDLSSGDPTNLAGLDVDLRIGTILDEALLAEAVAGAAAVVHLAAVPSVPRSIAEPMRSHEANATGTLRVLDAARRSGGAHVLLASSSSVYGLNRELPTNEDLRAEPISPYAASKLAGESYVKAYRHCYDLPVLAFRFFNVFGPLQPADHAYAAVVPAFVAAALDGRPLPIYGDGLQTRDFTHVDTVVATLMDAVARTVTSDSPVNLALGTRRTVLELVTALEEVFGRALPREHRPARPGDVRDSQADSQRLRELFPSVGAVPFTDALRSTVDWMSHARVASGVS